MLARSGSGKPPPRDFLGGRLQLGGGHAPAPRLPSSFFESNCLRSEDFPKPQASSEHIECGIGPGEATVDDIPETKWCNPMPTESEQQFREFAEWLGLSVEDVPTAEARRPDFLVRLPGDRSFFAEIKEIVPSREEAEQIRRVAAGQMGTWSVTPGDRLRPLIRKANQQLRTLSSRSQPGLLVVFNQERFLGHHTEGYAVLTAMRGLDEVPVTLPRDPADSPVFGEVRSGPEQAMRRDKHTSVAAIAVVRKKVEGGWEASLYHNRFADHPLAEDIFPRDVVPQYRIREDERDWEPVT